MQEKDLYEYAVIRVLPRVDRILDEGAVKAREHAGATLALVRSAMGLGR